MCLTPPTPGEGDTAVISADMVSFFFSNNFIEIEFTYHTVHLLKIHNLMTFGILHYFLSIQFNGTNDISICF